MAMSTEDRTDLTPRQLQRQSNFHYQRPGSPLKQEVLASPDIDSGLPSPTFSRTNDATHRWTMLAREAEADEISILSVKSEDRDYYTSLFDGTMPEEERQHVTVMEPVIVEGSRAASRLGSISGSLVSWFSEGVLVDEEYDDDAYFFEERKRREESVERFSEVDFDDTISLPPEPPLMPPPYSPIILADR
jgi:hypothetical protein